MGSGASGPVHGREKLNERDIVAAGQCRLGRLVGVGELRRVAIRKPAAIDRAVELVHTKSRCLVGVFGRRRAQIVEADHHFQAARANLIGIARQLVLVDEVQAVRRRQHPLRGDDAAAAKCELVSRLVLQDERGKPGPRRLPGGRAVDGLGSDRRLRRLVISAFDLVGGRLRSGREPEEQKRNRAQKKPRNHRIPRRK